MSSELDAKLKDWMTILSMRVYFELLYGREIAARYSNEELLRISNDPRYLEADEDDTCECCGRSFDE